MKNIVDFLINELVDFTGLSKDDVVKYVSREHYPYHSGEWEFWKPRNDQDIRWFYIANRAYLFSNAKHRLPEEVKADLRRGDSVLDFGGGSGNYSFEAFWAGCSRVTYFDVSIIQSEFVKYVTLKHDYPIHVIRANARNNWDLPKIENYHDAVFALDVFEHISDYPKYIETISNLYMGVGSKMYVYAPFGVGDPTHLKDNFGFSQTMNKNKLFLDKKVGVVDIWVKK